MRTNTEADSLEGFESFLSNTQISSPFTDPDGNNQPAYSANNVRSALKKATNVIIYDFHRFRLDSTPARTCSVFREFHNKDANSPSPLQISYSYSDGLGREIQKKIQAEPDAVNNRPLGCIRMDHF